MQINKFEASVQNHYVSVCRTFKHLARPWLWHKRAFGLAAHWLVGSIFSSLTCLLRFPLGQLSIVAVGYPAKAIFDFTEPRCSVLPTHFFDLFDGVERQVDRRCQRLKHPLGMRLSTLLPKVRIRSIWLKYSVAVIVPIVIPSLWQLICEGHFVTAPVLLGRAPMSGRLVHWLQTLVLPLLHIHYF